MSGYICTNGKIKLHAGIKSVKVCPMHNYYYKAGCQKADRQNKMKIPQAVESLCSGDSLDLQGTDAVEGQKLAQN